MHPDHPRAQPPPPGSPPGSGEAPPGPQRRETLPLSRTPLSTGLIVVSILVYVVTHFLLDLQEDPFALKGPRVADGEWWRVFTTVVQHGSLPHIAMNMFAVYAVGRMYEFQLGTLRFAQISLITTLSAAAAVLALSDWTVMLSSGQVVEVGTVGASGVILGWVGMVLPISKGTHREEIISLIAMNALISLIPFVSWQGHLGGFLGGLACGLVLRFGGKAAFRYAAPVLTFLFAIAIVLAVRMRG